MSPRVAPYGSWKSPITAKLVTEKAIGLWQLSRDGGNLYWQESRPMEGGRYVLVRCGPDGTIADVTPKAFNVRSRVHEYGGGAYHVRDGTVFFSNFADQRLYRQDPGAPPRPITEALMKPAEVRFADGRVTPDGRLMICVRERHREGAEALNEIVALPTDGSAPARAILSGYDFYAAPRISPDGKRLAWLCWNHPRMPWDGSELYLADLAPDARLSNARRVAGGSEESVYQPDWSPDGALHFVSDRTGWWNIYAERDGTVIPLAPIEAEIGEPQWIFGMGRYAFLSGGRIVCFYAKDGFQHVGVIAPDSGRITPVDLPYTEFGRPVTDGGDRLYFVGGSPSDPTSVVEMDLASGRRRVLKRAMDVEFAEGDLSMPRPVTFPTDGDMSAHALFYPPANKGFTGPAHERPPLIVFSHGGPTSATFAELRLGIQYWTSRGFAVVDVNYGGSTGYGREYRERLKGRWGVVDTLDCINAARYLERAGEVDGKRMAIRGGSAGGYTTLSALVFHDVFAAGASYFGVSDIESLAKDTHKFESRYCDGLIGPYPEKASLYRERSPIHYADRLSCPVILFQGLEDRVVPPSQAEVFVAALREKKLPFAYLSFEEEQHGFRKAETILRTLEAELYFYSRIFGFTPADEVAPVEIENLS